MKFNGSALRILKHFSDNSEQGTVYKLYQFNTGGDGTPLNLGTTGEARQELCDAVITSALKHADQGRTDIKYDKVLFTRKADELAVNDIVEQDYKRFVVVDVDPLESFNRCYLSVT